MSREYILESAAQVFRQKGFHGASMADIADVVQLQKASLYHHFGSKQEILLELLNRALDMVTAQMGEVLGQTLPADEKLRLAMRTYLKLLAERRDLVSVLLLEYRSLEPEFYTRHIPHRDQLEGMWREVLQEGVAGGIFDCEDVPLTVRGLLGMLNWTITWYRPDGPRSVEEISDHFADLFLMGLEAGGQRNRLSASG